MKIEFRSGPSNIDPWTLERLKDRSTIINDDLAYWVSYNGHAFRILSDTERRIRGGEDPEKVFMDSFTHWRPGIRRKLYVGSHTLELGVGSVPPKKLWERWSRGESGGLTTGTSSWWLYIDESDSPLCIPHRDIPDVLSFLGVSTGEEDLEIIKYIYGNKD